MKKRNLLLLGILSCFFCTISLWGQSNPPEQLRCDLLLQADYQSSNGFIVPVEWKSVAFTEKESVKILSQAPSFGWNLSRSEPGMSQSAYQILVADKEADLNEDKGDYWDSGKVMSSQSTGIIYGGKPLSSNKLYFWKVKVWDEKQAESAYSVTAAFFTDKELQEHATSRYPIQKEQEVPMAVCNKGNNRIVADFGKAAFCGQLYLKLTSNTERDTVIVHVGEAITPEGYVNRNPACKIRYYNYDLPLRLGTHTYQIQFRHGGGSIKIPSYIGQVSPFRYVELENYTGNVDGTLIVRNAVHYPYDDNASYFESPDTILNQVWELCKYSVKATSFAGQFIDGDRERKPYEGDNYIGQLTAYCVDQEYNLPRYSHEYSIRKPTWPTEWILISVMTAWHDYLYTGDLRSIRYYYNDLKAKCLMDFETDKHLISVSGTEKRGDPAIMAKIYHKGKISDIIDWPSRDGYVGGTYKSVINAYYYRDLVLMSKMAAALGKAEDIAFFQKKAAAVKKSFQDMFWDRNNKRYRDSDETEHASLHANIFPLAFGLVDEEYKSSVMDYIRSKGVACSIYGAQFLLEAVYAGEDGEYGRSLMNSVEEKSWYNMIREGSTVTMEAWGNKYKGNQDWNHIWGSAPGNIIMRELIGVKPIEPGWSKFQIKPQLGGLEWAKAKVPTIKGPVIVSYRQNDAVFNMNVEIPGNTEASVILPVGKGKKQVIVNGKQVKVGIKDKKIFLPSLRSGIYEITVNSQKMQVEKNNPFPMSYAKWRVLMEKNEKVIGHFEGKSLNELSERQRNKLLIAIARRTVLVYGPAYYRNYGEPIIEEKVYPKLPVGTKKERWPHAGKACYAVLFPYDLSKEIFTSAFIARVSIMKEDATVSAVDFGDSDMGKAFPTKDDEIESRQSYLEDRSQCEPYVAVAESRRQWVLKSIQPELEKYNLLKK